MERPDDLVTRPASSLHQPDDWSTELAQSIVTVMSHRVTDFQALLQSITDMRKTCATAGHASLAAQLDVLTKLLSLADPGLIPGVQLRHREEVSAEVAHLERQQTTLGAWLLSASSLYVKIPRVVFKRNKNPITSNIPRHMMHGHRSHCPADSDIG